MAGLCPAPPRNLARQEYFRVASGTLEACRGPFESFRGRWEIILDVVANEERLKQLHPGFGPALQYLRQTNLGELPQGVRRLTPPGFTLWLFGARAEAKKGLSWRCTAGTSTSSVPSPVRT